MLLTAAMIVRDEERHLGACLDSVAGVVDEVVVVDTGSTDRSVEIALAHGADVVRSEWRGEFAQARNVALGRARGEWILYIDADERLRPVGRAAVETLLRETEACGFRLLLHPFPGWTPYREYRLWRSDERIRFEGVIHEKVRPAILRVAEEDGRPVRDCQLRLDHFGYVEDQTRKHLRNVPLLRRQLALEPETIFNWRHLGVALRDLGQPAEAERALERAVALARRAPVEDVHGSLAYAELVRLRHAGGLDVSELLDEGLARWPDNWLLVWIRARTRMSCGRYDLALEDLDRLIGVDPDAVAESGVAYDGQLFGAMPLASRGRCLLELGRPTEAAAAYDAAAREDPLDPGHRVRRQLAEAVARRPAR